MRPLSIKQSNSYFTLTTAFTKLVSEGRKEWRNYGVSEILTAVSLSVRSRDTVTHTSVIRIMKIIN